VALETELQEPRIVILSATFWGAVGCGRESILVALPSLVVFRKVNLSFPVRDRDNVRGLVDTAHQLSLVASRVRVRVDGVEFGIIARLVVCRVRAIRLDHRNRQPAFPQAYDKSKARLTPSSASRNSFPNPSTGYSTA